MEEGAPILVQYIINVYMYECVEYGKFNDVYIYMSYISYIIQLVILILHQGHSFPIFTSDHSTKQISSQAKKLVACCCILKFAVPHQCKG